MKESTSFNGRFTFGKVNDLSGELTLDGRNTKLDVRHENFVHHDGDRDPNVFGVLEDHRHVSLIDCISISSTGSTSVNIGGEWQGHSSASMFPHYVIFGERKIDPDNAVISKVRLKTDGENPALYQPFLFCRAFDADDLLLQAIGRTAERLGHAIDTGSNPEMWFFAGHGDNDLGEIDLGKVTLLDRYRSSTGPSGISVQNERCLQIEFTKPESFHTALQPTFPIIQLFGLLGGAAQALVSMEFDVKSSEGNEDLRPFDVYLSLPTRNSVGDTTRTVHPIDVPVRFHDHPEEFRRVVTNWFSTHPKRREARTSGANCILHSGAYSAERLVTAANLFDLLPKEGKPKTSEISDDLRAARDEAKCTFLALPQSGERDGVLGALGRIGEPSLRDIILHRADLITAELSQELPEMDQVVRQAVLARNRYVHGSKGGFDYDKHPALRIFLIDSLEFIFLASELIDTGWDIKRWASETGCATHPLSRYLLGYSERLRALKEVLG